LKPVPPKILLHRTELFRVISIATDISRLRLEFVDLSEEVRDVTRAFVRSRWVAASALACASALGQTATIPPATVPVAAPLTFDVADVRANPPAGNIFPFTRTNYRSGRYDARNATMVDLIRTAYRVDADKVLGGPSWLESDRFDVHAKTSPSTNYETAMLMLRALLEDRFKLQVHNDTQPMPSYALKQGKRKLQLKEPDRSAPVGCRPQPFKPPAPGGAMPPQTVDCHNVTMASFAEQIRRMANGYLDKPVLDKTGIEGTWDLTLSWTARQQLGLAGSDGVSLFEALERIGLKLEPDTLPAPVVVVDSVNRTPTQNVPDIAKIVGETAPANEFEVAEVRPSQPDSHDQMFQPMPGGRLTVKGMNLKVLIQIAWDTMPDVIVGGPKWIDSDRFDIVAKAPESDPPEPFIDFDVLRLMLQSMLKEQFKLAMHSETQPGSVYALIAPKRPPKMKQADEDSRTFCRQSPSAIAGNPALTNSFTCQNTTMADFARMLRQIAGGYIDHPVIDYTELSGGWNFTLNWTARYAYDRVTRVGGGRGDSGTAPKVPVANDPNGGVSAFEAVEKLGLKLELQKHPVQVLVIDHAEPPTDN
jgi:uncharacterized protein (TIGR03435 family)